MDDLGQMGRWLVAIGLVVAGIGALLLVAHRVGLPIGRLPGDFSFGGERWRVYLPLGTSLLLSLVLTLLIRLLQRR